jgi:ABC-type antimicrobial peptide transport system ATPase subunit
VVIEEGSADQVLSDPIEERTRGFLRTHLSR